MVSIDGGGGSDNDGNGNESPKLGRKEAFVGCGCRRDDRCVSRERGGQWRGSVATRDSSAVGGDAVLLFIMPSRVEGGSVLCRWRR